MASAERPEVLRLAILLHDIGKATPDINHSETGAEKAREVGDRIGLDPDSTDLLAFLIGHHQVMSETAQLRDMTQDQTIRDFVAVVESEERLQLLYLLTYADMSATGPGVWTAVSSRFIEELYHRSDAVLRHGLPDADDDAGYRRRIQQELSLHNLPAEEIERHCSLMPASYLLNTPPEEIAAHVRAIDRLKTETAAVDFVPAPGGHGTLLTLYAVDDPTPGLLSRVAAALYANDVEVHSAQVYTRGGDPRIAVDTLWTTFHGEGLPSLKRRDLEKDILSVVTRRVTTTELLQRRGKRSLSRLVPRIEIRNDLSERHSVVEVDGADLRGLLLRATRAMAMLGWHIHSARISTLDGEARDAFYVTDPSGARIGDDVGPLLEELARDPS